MKGGSLNREICVMPLGHDSLYGQGEVAHAGGCTQQVSLAILHRLLGCQPQHVQVIGVSDRVTARLRQYAEQG
ncbi:hypothetical protein C0Q70_04641 [Pomacea canaliculata]|uniref:Uncharacterized protein n=1 Tax=Pomacea canaliculata TaxID=400727 RepID=A0A2T7PIX9_POMCA|nr:hypothetical protein C0Q70_04641 [Pomacea canaliculata]